MLVSTPAITVPLHLREYIGTRYRQLSTRSVDALRRQLEVVILFQRGADELLQLWVLEDLPPGKICVGFCLSLRLRVFSQIMVRGWRLNDGLMVVRADLAPTDQNRGQDRENQWLQLLH